MLLEHTFRLFKQTLGWTAPKVRDPHTADLWTWLIIAAHTQLRLTRPLAEDLRRPSGWSCERGHSHIRAVEGWDSAHDEREAALLGRAGIYAVCMDGHPF